MTNRIFFDLDGTLIDSRRRLYSLFAQLAPENTFSYEAYWEVKRKRKSQHDFLREYFEYSDAQVEFFRRAWMSNVEDPERLRLDQPFEGVSDLLAKLALQRELYLITARQYPARVKTQVHQFGWSAYFRDIFVTRQQESKASLIREKLTCTGEDILVGDTGEDILSGRELGMKTVAVLSGVLSAEVLMQYRPDQLVDSVVTNGWY
jgi:phosphoglycolate phosphatase